MKPTQFPAHYWIRQDDGRLRCELCPHRCRLKNGQRGRCFLRVAENDEIRLSAWGRTTGLALDPIEKKPLYHFFPSSTVLSFGTIGCNLSCSFCQNWDISAERDLSRLRVETSPELIAQKARDHGAESVAFTYNEPIIFIEYVMETARACHERGIRTVAVTAGSILPEPRRDFFSVIDAANVDLKSFREQTYSRLCGGALAPVLETLQYITRETSVWLEITTLLIPGENDSEEEIRELSRWISNRLRPEIPLHFTAFHPAHRMLQTPPTPLETLLRAREIALEEGLLYVYSGNVLHTESSTTRCSRCGEILIERKGYRTRLLNLGPSGRCLNCGQSLPGRFA